MKIFWLLASIGLMMSCNERQISTSVIERAVGSFEHVRTKLPDSSVQVIVLFSDGAVRQQYRTVAGKREGAFTEYYENGLISGSENYINDTLNGRGLTFYENGQIRDAYIYDKGQQVSLTQYNIDGTRRGLKLFENDTAYLLRIWSYDDQFNVTKVESSICASIFAPAETNGDSLMVRFYLPLDTEEFPNSGFTLRYLIQSYKEGKVVSRKEREGLKFQDNLVFVNAPVSANTDSVVVYNFISLQGIEYEPCKSKVMVKK